ncbi:MAG TPA: hypothetical protein DF383_03415, partial [Deltaproteobacteria bacterium]|nr:hypothetical protein [Deltaproteobacteria bacterium]
MMRRAVVFTFVFLYGIAFLPGSLFEKVSHAEQAAGFESTWAAFKTALEKDDKEAVAGMIQFPIEYTLPQFMAKDKAEFLSKYSGIFPP